VNIKKDLGERERLELNRLDLAQDKGKCTALVNTVMNLGVA
jgi:hypothetical protein